MHFLLKSNKEFFDNFFFFDFLNFDNYWVSENFLEKFVLFFLKPVKLYNF